MAVNPFYWLVSRDRLKPVLLWALLAVVWCIAIWFWFTFRAWQWKEPFCVMFVLATHGIVKLWLASEASHNFEEQRRSGALELLLACTPLDVVDLVRGQWLGLRRVFLWPVIVSACVDICLMLICYTLYGRALDGDMVLAIWAAIVMLFLDAIALGWVAMWLGVSTKPRQASGKAIMLVMVLPWVLFYLIMAASEICSLLLGSRYRFDIGFGAVLTIWLSLGIVVDVVVSIWARRHLLKDMRAYAMAHAEESIGWVGKVGRLLGQLFRSSRGGGEKVAVPPLVIKR